ncbi:hypothetical protein [Rhodococcus koreensis]|uniref:hypothetical protein n=1 Tax=Rhodococcus koreensis TaxID=99653 RepID=UPI00366FE85D
MGNDGFLPVMLGHVCRTAGGWGWHAELRGDLRRRLSRLEGLDHRPGKEVVAAVAAGDGTGVVSIHRKTTRPGPLGERGVECASVRL